MNTLAVLLATVLTGITTVSVIPAKVDYCEFSSTKPIVQKRQLSDYNGNKFKLYELEGGYAIYSLADEQETFIEGSYETQSPYFNYSDKEVKYLGPGNYFYEEQGKTFDIINQSRVTANLQNASYQLNESIEPYASVIPPNINETKTDAEGYTLINRAEYFKYLSYFPENWFGECGLVALSIMLGYYDTFYNDNFIPNDKKYTGRYYKSITRSSGGGNYELDYTLEEPLIKTVRTAFRDTTNHEFTTWSLMPGTNYAMRDYLFDNYLHTYLGIGNENSGYPMTDTELKSTFNDYINANCPSLVNTYDVKSGHIWYTNNAVQNCLHEGLPTCLVLKSYNIASTLGKDNADHIVVAYGHKDRKYLVHMGWGSGKNDYASIIISDATIYGYFAIQYNGEHVHSRNVWTTLSSTRYEICGCGHVEVIK